MDPIRPFRFLSLLALALAVACGPGKQAPEPSTAADFETAVKERLAAYESLQADPSSMEPMLNGRYREIHERLEALVPDAEKTGVDHFILGNMLYSVDPERSFAHHAEAYAAYPRVPSVILEMAYQHHRRGDCDEALPLYERLGSIGWLNAERHALLAHCQLELGRHADAVQSWSATGYGDQSSRVEPVIHQVFGELAPLARHDALMLRVAEKDESAVGPLLANALKWEQSWWSRQPNLEAFRAAVSAIEQSFGPESDIAREVGVLSETLDVEDPEVLGEKLREAGLLVDGGRLPTSSFVAKELVHDALRTQLASDSDLERFLPELLERARTGKDLAALDTAAGLLSQMERREDLAEVNLLGWETYGEERYASSYLALRKAEVGGELSHDDPYLQKALADFPEAPRFARVALVLATREGVDTPDLAARLIDAEYHGLRSDRNRRATYLNAYYAELAKRLPEGTADNGDSEEHSAEG